MLCSSLILLTKPLLGSSFCNSENQKNLWLHVFQKNSKTRGQNFHEKIGQRTSGFGRLYDPPGSLISCRLVGFKNRFYDIWEPCESRNRTRSSSSILGEQSPVKQVSIYPYPYIPHPQYTWKTARHWKFQILRRLKRAYPQISKRARNIHSSFVLVRLWKGGQKTNSDRGYTSGSLFIMPLGYLKSLKGILNMRTLS